MPDRVIDVRGRKPRFLIYSGATTPDARLAEITRVPVLVPDAHLALIPPAIIVLHEPGGRDGDGPWHAANGRGSSPLRIRSATPASSSPI